MRLVRYFLSFYLFFSGLLFFAEAQDLTCKWKSFPAEGASFLLDSMSVLQSSISVKDPEGNGYSFNYNINSGFITVDAGANEQADSLLFCYQTLPYSLHKVYSNRTLLEHYDSMAYFKDKRSQASKVFDFREEVFSSPRLDQSGNMTRGISFGNAQNVFVNSSLNLQMEGELTDNLNIRASITDQNVPFQPEGNTQQIQDFDNVLIELYNDQINLAGGDVVLTQRKSEFLRYYKNVQGVQFTSDYEMNDQWKASTQLSASIAKGKFASVHLEISEGVMGPYRIRGPGNERFVIVMANSEKVFLDGKQLKRGFNNDYIIDYNQGEITFTPNVIITRYSRVRVDFEYAERNFSRSILAANHIQENDRVTFYVNYYREKDDRNRPLFMELSARDKQLLASVGDDLQAAAVPRIDSIPFDPNRILYKKATEMDESGKLYEYFEYSQDPEKAFYSLSFTEVGAGNGNYRRKQQLANGVVYEYVHPINGNPQGNFSIKSPLPAPNKKQMVTAGTQIKLSNFEKIYTEVALSDQDDNLFSDLDNNDNKGYALKSGILSENRKLKGLQGYQLNSRVEIEYNSANFSFIDRFRYIEFDRDWNLDATDLEDRQSEKLANASVEIAKDRHNMMAYGVHFRNRGTVLTGVQQTAKYNQQLASRVYVENDIFSLNSRIKNLDSKWWRYTGEMRYQSKLLVPGYRLSLDRNAVVDAESDSVVSTAMNFLEHRFFIRTNDTLDYTFFADASWREDQFPVNGQLLPDTKAFTTNYGLSGRFGPHQVKGTFTYRKLSHIHRELPEESTVMGKIDYHSSLADNNIRKEFSYALGNGRELRREFVFLPVPTGEGTHTWRDDNGDGVQQLNEFYPAVNPEEKNYIKVFMPTDDYIQAYTTLFNYRLNAKFPDQWRKEKGWRKWFSRFSNNTGWNVEKKITAGDFFSRVSPLAGGIANEDLISVRQTFRSSLFFNRSSPKFGFDLSMFNSQHKQLLTGGYEHLLQEDWRLNTRYNFSQYLNTVVLWNKGLRQSASDFLDNRNYRINQQIIGPEVNIQPSSFFRTSLQYHLTRKRNLANEEFDEKASLHEASINIRYAKAIKTTLNTHLRYTYIDYNGTVNSPTGYEMLQALTPGNNYIWSVNWLQKIGEGLQMNMIYEGRNSEGLQRIVHTGRMQVSALF
ncbi:hypothetical protein [Negadavirga shengliensis]|uniref:Uncharacterized protein n=1 Tax=Negadavirga shengliensis TaxID=1389218 RepID=A0ABV9SUY5_9BACT